MTSLQVVFFFIFGVDLRLVCVFLQLEYSIGFLSSLPSH